MNKLIQQIFKFGIVGILAFLSDYILLIVLTEKFHIYYLISSTISFTIALLFNYFFSMAFVFKRKQDLSRRKEFVIFALLSIVGLLINQICMWFGSGMLNIDYRITKFFATVIVMIWNFITRKILLESC